MLSRMVSSDWARARWPGPTLTSLKNDSTCQKHYTIRCVCIYLFVKYWAWVQAWSILSPNLYLPGKGIELPSTKPKEHLGPCNISEYSCCQYTLPHHINTMTTSIMDFLFYFVYYRYAKNSTRDHMTGLLTSPRSNVEVKPEVTALIMAPIVKEPCPKSSVIWDQCCLTMCHAGSRPPGFLLISCITAGTSWGRILVGSRVYPRNLR